MLNIFKSKKIIVTGHTGFKGSWLSVWLNELGAKVTGISLKPPTTPSHYEELGLYNFINDIQLDIRNLDQLKNIFLEVKPDFVFHLAAQPLVKKSYENPFETYTCNLIGSLNILESLKSISNTCCVIMITSDKSYANKEWEWGYRENDELGGLDPYSASKGSTELMIRSHINSFFPIEKGVKISIARAGNVIGGGDWAEDRIVPDTAKAWIENQQLIIRSPNATRPWQHVLEPLSGYLNLAFKLYQDSSLHGEAFNFGPNIDDNRTVYDLINELSIYWKGLNFKKSNDNNSFHESMLLKLNCDKALYHLKWKSKLDFKDTVKMTADWYLNYYKKKVSVLDFTKEQINFYQSNI